MKPENLFTKVFDRGLHESYDRRARQDRVIDYMTSRNFFPQSAKASDSISVTSGAGFFCGDQNTNNQKRKEKIIQNHSVLAQQIEMRRKAKEAQRAEGREWAQFIRQEAQNFEAEQRKKKLDRQSALRQNAAYVRNQYQTRSELLKEYDNAILSPGP